MTDTIHNLCCSFTCQMARWPNRDAAD